ncbi:MAG TPA: hypothetical protein PLS31_08295 [Candidatus Sumerlaeota bacterium]|nr:MAG: hypothetical protein BWY12_00005 [candidate division BRC1 bacterium ADurb.Bin183]HQH12411.1 hypothetical protein [Candidatus Sumerlaeota bacterium]
MKKWRGLLFILLAAAQLSGCRMYWKHSDANEYYRRGRYPVDGRNFSPVDKYLANQTEPVEDDAEGALNPYVLRVIEAYPKDGSYPYRCIKAPEYDLYLGVTQNLYYKGRILAKAHPNNTRCSYCCGLTFEIFVRAMQLRNMQKGMDPDDFNGMSFYDLFNLLQIWFIEGSGDSPQKGIEYYGLGKKIEDWEEARAGDFMDLSRNNRSGHSVIFIEWVRDDAGKIIGLKYFSSNKSGVGYLTEYFSDSGGKVLRKWIRLARVGSVENYKPFDRLKIPLRRAYAP